MIVKDEFERYYKVVDGMLMTPMGKQYMTYEEAKKKLRLRKARKSWEQICKEWKPAGKLVRSKRNRNR